MDGPQVSGDAARHSEAEWIAHLLNDDKGDPFIRDGSRCENIGEDGTDPIGRLKEALSFPIPSQQSELGGKNAKRREVRALNLCSKKLCPVTETSPSSLGSEPVGLCSPLHPCPSLGPSLGRKRKTPSSKVERTFGEAGKSRGDCVPARAEAPSSPVELSVVLKTLPKVTGVFFDRSQERWVSSVYMGGRNIKTYFPVYKHGFYKARELAVTQRLSQVSHKGLAQKEAEAAATPFKSAEKTTTRSMSKERASPLPRAIAFQRQEGPDEALSLSLVEAFEQASTHKVVESPGASVCSKSTNVSPVSQLSASPSLISLNAKAPPLAVESVHEASAVWEGTQRFQRDAFGAVISTIMAHSALSLFPWQAGVSWDAQSCAWMVEASDQGSSNSTPGLRRVVPVRGAEGPRKMLASLEQILKACDKAQKESLSRRLRASLAAGGEALTRGAAGPLRSAADPCGGGGSLLGAICEAFIQANLDAPAESGQASSDVLHTLLSSPPAQPFAAASSLKQSRGESLSSAFSSRLKETALADPAAAKTRREGVGGALEWSALLEGGFVLQVEAAAEELAAAVVAAYAEALEVRGQLQRRRASSGQTVGVVFQPKVEEAPLLGASPPGQSLVLARPFSQQLKAVPSQGGPKWKRNPDAPLLPTEDALRRTSSLGSNLPLYPPHQQQPHQQQQPHPQQQQQGPSSAAALDASPGAVERAQQRRLDLANAASALQPWVSGVSWDSASGCWLAQTTLESGSRLARTFQPSSRCKEEGLLEAYARACAFVKRAVQQQPSPEAQGHVGGGRGATAAFPLQQQAPSPSGGGRDAATAAAANLLSLSGPLATPASAAKGGSPQHFREKTQDGLDARRVEESPFKVAAEKARSAEGRRGSVVAGGELAEAFFFANSKHALRTRIQRPLVGLQQKAAKKTCSQARVLLAEFEQSGSAAAESSSRGQTKSEALLDKAVGEESDSEAQQLMNLQQEAVRRCLLDLRDLTGCLYTPHVRSQKVATVDAHVEKVSALKNYKDILVYIQLFESALFGGQLPSRMAKETQRVFFGALEALTVATKMRC